MAAEDLQQLRELVEFLKANGIAEFDMERTDLKVRLKFAGLQPSTGVDASSLSNLASAIAAQGAAQVVPVAVPAALPSVQAAAGQASAPPVAAPAGGAAAAEAGPEAGAHIVKSPIVGTFYDAPSPDADPFVKVGDRVSTGQVLCIVEAMKLMNEIESDFSGEVVKVYVKTGQPVEYGQALFAIK
ncbi:MAG TPA: acetyl-CoA carboxylase biotin carboxyl carrier protein [Acidobacteriaceae bacterium]|nr:acetyl-CoA carboxylase biotin carboxyl carrier protein [Acidobacteriaceae bacterium]